MPSIPEHSSPAKVSLKRWSLGVVRLIVVTALFGWLYAWASPYCFPKEKAADWAYGVMHGALMPMAFPSLVMGQNVEIYSTHNTGRPYKLGYIAGINACGLVFFGSIFWRPKAARLNKANS